MTPRRAFILRAASVVALPATAAIPTTACTTPPNPDANLIAWCHEAIAIDAESDRLYLLCCDIVRPAGTPEWVDYQTHSDATMPRWRELAALIGSRRATTVAGFKAKATLLRRQLEPDLDEDDHQIDLAWSLVEDVLAMGA